MVWPSRATKPMHAKLDSLLRGVEDADERWRGTRDEATGPPRVAASNNIGLLGPHDLDGFLDRGKVVVTAHRIDAPIASHVPDDGQLVHAADPGAPMVRIVSDDAS